MTPEELDQLINGTPDKTEKTIEIKEWKDFAWQEHSGVKQDVFDQPSSTSPYSFTLNSNSSQIILGFKAD